jgi:D-sedoheptulose 7-phosphate isomerase
MPERNINKHIDTLIERYPKLLVCRESIQEAYDILKKAYTNGRKLLVCGNGGSASDSEHIVGELMKEFKLKREVYKDQAEAMKQIDPELGSICVSISTSITRGSCLRIESVKSLFIIVSSVRLTSIKT